MNKTRRAAEMMEASRHHSFDVICAGQPLWQAAPHQRRNAAPAVRARLLNIATMLASTGVRVGLATALEDDRFGRGSRAEMAALGIDVGAVKLASAVAELVIIDASGGQSCVTSAGGEATDPEIPLSWSSRVWLLSGVSAITSSLAALCKAARRARRQGTVVVLDVVGSLRHWAGRDPRVLSMVLREADVVRCSVFDLAVIGMDSTTVRRAMRSNATLVVNDAAGTAAVGTFGDVKVQASPDSVAPQRFAEGCAAAICAEVARPKASPKHRVAAGIESFGRRRRGLLLEPSSHPRSRSSRERVRAREPRRELDCGRATGGHCRRRSSTSRALCTTPQLQFAHEDLVHLHNGYPHIPPKQLRPD